MSWARASLSAGARTRGRRAARAARSPRRCRGSSPRSPTSRPTPPRAPCRSCRPRARRRGGARAPSSRCRRARRSRWREPGEPGAREPDAREELGVLVRVHAPDRALADAEREDARVAREVEAVRVVLAVHAQLAVRDRPEHGVARIGQVDRGLEHVVDRVVARAERRLQRRGGGGRAGGGSVRKARSRPDALLLSAVQSSKSLTLHQHRRVPAPDLVVRARRK